MSNRSRAAGLATLGRRRRLGRIVSALTAVLVTLTLTSGDVRAERIVLKSGEVVEGSIIDATRNTVVIQRSIGGMRQMRIRDIEEVRFDLAQGEEIAGEFLGWADGVYQVRSGEQIVRVSEDGILSREPRQEVARQAPQRPPSRPMGQQNVTAAAAPPPPTAEPVAPEPQGQDQSEAAADAASSAAAEAESDAAAEAETEAAAAADGETEAAAEAETEAAADAETEAAADAKTEAAAAADVARSAVGDAETEAAADAENQTAGEAESRAAAGNENAAVGDQASVAVGDQASPVVRASVDPPEPGARSMVFKIELSQPAAQTVVLIYGTVDGTAKAGEDYEAQQGMVTLTPGTKTAEVQVPLIEGEPGNGEKRFELVLMADPKIADVVDRRVTATIKSAD